MSKNFFNRVCTLILACSVLISCAHGFPAVAFAAEESIEEQTAAIDENLLETPEECWTYGVRAGAEASAKHELVDGSLLLNEVGATFRGKKVNVGETITVQFSATRAGTNGKVAIQFGGEVTEEKIGTSGVFLDGRTDVLSLLLRNDNSNGISISGNNQNLSGTQTVDNAWDDGNVHTVQITTTDSGTGGITVTVKYDGETKIATGPISGFGFPSYISIVSLYSTDLTVKGVQIGDWKVEDFQKSPNLPTIDQNLLETPEEFWAYGRYDTASETYRQDDGSFVLDNSGVAFLGQKAESEEKITVKFSANKPSDAGWAAIQFRGDLTEEKASTKDIFYHEGHNGLVLLLRGDGNISINDSHGSDNGGQKNWTGSVDVGGWSDDKDHIVEIVVKDNGGNGISVTVTYDGVKKITDCKITGFTDPSLVSMVAYSGAKLTVKGVQIGNWKVEDFKESPELPTIDQNLLETPEEFWAYGVRTDYETNNKHELANGSLTIMNAGATFLGKPVEIGQTITMEFSATRPGTAGSAAIQFGGEPTKENAGTENIFYDKHSDVLSLLLRSDTDAISINANMSPVGEKKTVASKWDNGETHTVQITTADAGNGKITVTVEYDGVKVIDSLAVTGYTEASYVSIVSLLNTNLTVKGIQIDGWKVEDFKESPKEPDPATNLLNADPSNWIQAGSADLQDQEGKDNKALVMGNGGTGATFVGTLVKEQKIAVTLKANGELAQNDWMAIQFRGNLKSWDADDAEKARYYSAENDSLALVIKKGGTAISINKNDGKNSPGTLSGSVNDLTLFDGNEHTVEILATDNADTNTVAIEVWVDGKSVLTCNAPEKYAGRSGYVTVSAQNTTGTMTIKDVRIDGRKADDFGPFVGPQFAEGNLLGDFDSWVVVGDSGRQYDGRLLLGNTYATYTGAANTVNQKITLKFTANGLTDWAGIQFRGKLAEWNTADTQSAIYSSEVNDALALVINEGGKHISIKGATGDLSGSNTQELNLADNKEHTVVMTVADITDSSGVSIKVWVDPASESPEDTEPTLSYTAPEDYIGRTNYVTLACFNGNDSVTITDFRIEEIAAQEPDQPGPGPVDPDPDIPDDPYVEIEGDSLLNAEPSNWILAGANWQDDQESKTLEMPAGGTGATFVGTLVEDQKIAVTLKTDGQVASGDWMAIQFRGNLKSWDADDAVKAQYFSAENDGLALVIKNGGTKISVNNRNNADGKPNKLSNDAENLNLFDGNEHTVVIQATDNADTNTVAIEVWVDGESVLKYNAPEKYAGRSGYVTVSAQNTTGTVTIKDVRIDGHKAEEFEPFQVPQFEEGNLLAETGGWVVAGDNGQQYDGSLLLGNTQTYATYTGQTLKNQKIAVKFNGTFTGSEDWTAIQFRGNLTAEDAANIGKALYYSAENDALALVIKNGGDAISVNQNNGTGEPGILPGTETVSGLNLCDGNEHTVEILVSDSEDGKTAAVQVWVDGESKLTCDAPEKYVGRGGYVTVSSYIKEGALTVTDFRLEKQEGDNLLDVDTDYWTVTGGSVQRGEELKLSNNYATFTGQQVEDGQTITVKFKAELDEDVAEIQFRGKLTKEDAKNADKVHYYSEENDALALVIKNKGTAISINQNNGTGNPGVLPGTETVSGLNLCDGEEHTIQITATNSVEPNSVIRTVDNADGTVNIVVLVDGVKKISCDAPAKYADRTGFVTLTCFKSTDTLTVTDIRIEGVKAEKFPDIQTPVNPGGSTGNSGSTVSGGGTNSKPKDKYGEEPTEDLLTVESGWWAYGRYSANAPEAYRQEDGSFVLDNAGAAFLGQKAESEQKITVKFSAKRASEVGWAAIQFRGDLTAEQAATKDIFYHEGHNGLVLLLRGDGKISINDSHGNNGGQKNWSGSVDVGGWDDGKDHIVDIVVKDTGSGGITVTVYYDGVQKINNCRITGFTDPSYVSLVGYAGAELTVKGVQIGDWKTADFRGAPEPPKTDGDQPTDDNNLLEAPKECWTYGVREGLEASAKHELANGGLTLVDAGATFLGRPVEIGQTITMEFSATRPGNAGSAAIQFGGELTTEKAGTKDIFYEGRDDVLSLLLRSGSDGISISGNGKKMSGTKSVDSPWYNGETHTVQIAAADAGNGKITVTVHYDGVKVIDSLEIDGFTKASYVSIVSLYSSELTVKSFRIDGVKVSDFSQEQDKQHNLTSDSGSWVVAGDNGLKSDGTLVLGQTYATFVGAEVKEQKIGVKFRGTVADSTDWMAIQFRGTLTAADAAEYEKAPYFSAENDALALVIKQSGTVISVNNRNGEGNPDRLSENVEGLNLFDGKEHTIEISAADSTDGKSVAIRIFVDGAGVLTCNVPEKYAGRSGYVTLGCYSKNDTVCVTGFWIEGVQETGTPSGNTSGNTQGNTSGGASGNSQGSASGEAAGNPSENAPQVQGSSLLAAEPDNWIIAGGDGLQSDGTLLLNRSFATFIGTPVTDQTVTVGIKGALTKDSDWMVIQFRGILTAEDAADYEKSPYFSAENDALTLVIKNCGTVISVNNRGAEGGPNRLSENVEGLNLYDGKEHTISLRAVNGLDGKSVTVQVWVDGASKLICNVPEKYASRSGYVTLGCYSENDSIAVTDFRIEGYQLSQPSNDPQDETTPPQTGTEDPGDGEQKPTVKPDETPTLTPDETPDSGRSGVVLPVVAAAVVAVIGIAAAVAIVMKKKRGRVQK